MTANEAVQTKKNVPFSYVIEDGENGEGVVRISLCGHREDWAPELRQSSIYGNGYEDVLEEVMGQLGDSLKEVVTIEICFSKVQESKDVITSISEIPSVVKGTTLPVFRLTGKVKGINRDVIVLGETHIATKDEAKAASQIMPYFTNFGCEGIDTNGFIEAKFFFWFMDKIGNFFNFLLSFGRRNSKNKNSLSLVKDYAVDIQAKKRVIPLEKGWHPSFRLRILLVLFPLYFFWSMFNLGLSGAEIGSEHGYSWTVAFLVSNIIFWLGLTHIPIIKHIFSFIFGLILDYVFDLGPSRNRNMVKNLVVAMEEDDSIDCILVLAGKSHIKPMVKILKRKYGFIEKSFN